MSRFQTIGLQKQREGEGEMWNDKKVRQRRMECKCEEIVKREEGNKKGRIEKASREHT